MITQDEAVAQVLASRTVSLDIAAASIPMGRNKAYRLARKTGQLVDGVPVIRKGEHGYVVPTPALRQVLQLEDSPLGARLSQGGNGEERAATPLLVSVPEPLPQRKDRLSGNSTRR